MQLFYTPDIHPLAKEYLLNEEESRHCASVLRFLTGNEVHLIDGKGNLYHACILVAHPKKTLLRIDAVTTDYKKRNHYLHLAVAPTKNIDRFEWFLEKATEIGVDEITPLICQRSERREVKIERLNKIITSAIKQSEKAYHPLLNEAVNHKQFIQEEFDGQKFIAHCENEEKLSLSAVINKNFRYLVLIGPEGDFSQIEIEDARQRGFKAITLGDSRLRTETAALEACFEVNFLNR